MTEQEKDLSEVSYLTLYIQNLLQIRTNLEMQIIRLAKELDDVRAKVQTQEKEEVKA